MRRGHLLLASILVVCIGAQAAAQKDRSSVAPGASGFTKRPDFRHEADRPGLLPRLLVVPPEVVAVGEKALSTFRTLVPKGRYQRAGFKNAEQLRKATLSTPMMEAFIPLLPLKSYNPQKKAEDLLSPTQRVRFPIAVGDGVVASITLGQVKGEWKPVRYGDASKSATIQRVLGVQMRARSAHPLSFFEVTVPALGVFFLGHFQGGRLLLTPLRNDARFGFVQGKTEDGRVALTKLVPAAQNHDGQPT